MRYFFGQDNSSHWYLVQADKWSDWLRWSELEESDERSWTVPEYATRLDYGPMHYSFTELEEINV